MESKYVVYILVSTLKFKIPKDVDDNLPAYSLVMEESASLLDNVLSAQPAQLAGKDGFPSQKWTYVRSTLLDIDTTKLHYVQVPQKHIVIDFDLKEINGKKDTSLDRNLEAASRWPPTYAEISKSGKGTLRYTYEGDTSELANIYSEGIEIKAFAGDASLRRKLTRCNNIQISSISSGLPLKPKKEKMLKAKTINSEKGLRELIERNLRKEIHPGTKPSIDFIAYILEEAYDDGLKFDVSDLRPRLVAFANNSTHQARLCLKTVQTMKIRLTKN